MKVKKTLLAAAVVLAFNAMASPIEVDGIKIEDITTVAGVPLKLNGAGTRHKGAPKVYVAALYLGKKTSLPEEAFAQPGPKRLSLTMVRDLDSKEFGKLFTRSLTDNADKASMAKLVAGLRQMGEIFAQHKTISTEDNVLLDWVPGIGTIVTVNGRVQGEPLREPEFFKALMAIWLGHAPADGRLKDALLGIH